MKKLLASISLALFLAPGAALALCPNLSVNAVALDDVIVNHQTGQVGTREALGNNWRSFGAEIVRRDVGHTQYCNNANAWVRSNTAVAIPASTVDELNRICNSSEGSLIGGKTCKQCIDRGGTPWKVVAEIEATETPAGWICKSTYNGCWSGWTNYQNYGRYQGGSYGNFFGDCNASGCTISTNWYTNTPSCSYWEGQSRNSEGCEGGGSRGSRNTAYGVRDRRACY